MKKTSEAPTRETVGLILALIGIGIIAIAGYTIFRRYITLFIPDLISYSILLVAIVAGIATFFSPCTFAVLPSYPLYYYSTTQEIGETRYELKTILTLGLFAAIGFGKTVAITGGDTKHLCNNLQVNGHKGKRIPLQTPWTRYPRR